MREIVLDTETTGLDPGQGHRIVEIGAIALENHVPSGEPPFHRYLDPQRDVPPDAFAVHGLSNAFLNGKPRFADIAEELLDFIGQAPLVMHNAGFDLSFLNAELERAGRVRLSRERTIDTVEIARRRYPGAPASLDALCRRYQIDLTERTLHGALKDAQLLASVYLELCGGREPGLVLVTSTVRRLPGIEPSAWRPKLVQPTAEEKAAHQAFVARLTDALWLQQPPAREEARTASAG